MEDVVFEDCFGLALTGVGETDIAELTVGLEWRGGDDEW